MTSSPPRTIHGESLIMASNSSSSSSSSSTIYDKDCDDGTTNYDCNSGSNRHRINSRDIVRSYSGLFGREGDMLGFELARNEHTDWLERGGFLLLGTYVGGICVFQLIVLAVLDSYDSSSSSSTSASVSATGSSKNSISIPLHWSWTVTNAIHCIVTTIYVHWSKGSMFDEHGELAGMTLWEQIEGRSNTLMVKRTLAIVPTLLCYAACHFSEYSYVVCFANVVLWIISMMGKLPIMNGVRIFGINQTTGIDDNYNYINNNENDNNENYRRVAARKRRSRRQQQQPKQD
mmetsp:Transcript_28063/g.31537  ORF Transcript_28063/g.31537 Transcript_28063/m.31537 type:complete len:289 (-) Transcript_28063:98-964(-)